MLYLATPDNTVTFLRSILAFPVTVPRDWFSANGRYNNTTPIPNLPSNLYVAVSLAKSQLRLFISPWTVICYMSMRLGIVAWCTMCLIWAMGIRGPPISPFPLINFGSRVTSGARGTRSPARIFAEIAGTALSCKKVPDEDRFVATDAAEPDCEGEVETDKLIGFLMET